MVRAFASEGLTPNGTRGTVEGTGGLLRISTLKKSDVSMGVRAPVDRALALVAQLCEAVQETLPEVLE